MICQACGVEAPTRYVAFYQNIGLLVMRLSRSVEGNLCKSCIHGAFWRMTAITLLFGPWGMISLIVSPCFILNNVIRYLLCLGMEPVPFGAAPPSLSEDVVHRIEPYTEDLIAQLNSGEEFQRVTENIAMKAGVSKGQVALYLHALAAAADRQSQ